MFIEFDGAMKSGEEYVSRGKIYINSERIDAFYDHTVLIGDKQIRVMEEAGRILEKVNLFRVYQNMVRQCT